ncbi:MAG: cell division protein FtsZ [Candidatus Bipolaricaulaceae bacterium]
MEQRKGKEELAQLWKQLLAQVQDRMLRACLPTSGEKVHLDRDTLVIEVDSAFKKRYVQRKLPKLREAARALWGPVEVRVTELPLIEEMERAEAPAPPAHILVVGVGDGGINALERMREAGLYGVRLVAADTDAQVLSISHADQKLQLGRDITRGRGTGGDPEKGRLATEAAAWEVETLVADAHMVFLTCGLGGGTGTGAAPVIAKRARQAGALTVGVVTLPFTFEGAVRAARAQAGLEQLGEQADVLIVIRNDKLLEMVPSVSLPRAFELADEVLRIGVQGISDLITVPGIVNLDFADVAAVLRGAGTAMMGTGEGQGEARAARAAKAAATNPLLEGGSIRGARKLLLNITGGEDLTLAEVTQVAEAVRKTIAADADLTFGAVVREELAGRMKVTVIAADFQHSVFEDEEKEKKKSSPQRPRSAAEPRRGAGQENVDIPAFLRRRGEG